MGVGRTPIPGTKFVCEGVDEGRVDDDEGTGIGHRGAEAAVGAGDCPTARPEGGGAIWLNKGVEVGVGSCTAGGSSEADEVEGKRK